LKTLGIFFVFCLIGLRSLASEIKLHENSYHSSFYDKIEYIECQPDELSIESIVSSDSIRAQFSPVPYGVNFPYPSKAYWLHFRVRNTSPEKVYQIISIKNPNLNEVFAYQCRDNSIETKHTAGDSHAFSERGLEYLDLLFPFTFSSNVPYDIYLYVYNHTDEIFIPISIASPHKFIEKDTMFGHYRAFGMGMLVFVILGMIFLAVATKSRLSIYFLLYVLSISIFLANFWGITQQFIWPNLAILGIRLNPLCIILAVLFAQYFNRLFINADKNSKIADTIIKYLTWLSWASFTTLLLPLNLNAIPQGTTIMLATLASIATPVCGILTLRKIPRESLYLTASSIPILITVSLYILRFTGAVQSDMLLLGFDSAFIIELIVLMFGIVDQYRVDFTRSLTVLEDANKKEKEHKEELERSNNTLKLTIQEKEAMQKKLLQAHKLETIGKLAGGIAHDFNNLLTPIIGYSEMSLESVEKGSDLHSDLLVILRSSKRAKQLVNQILTFSKHFKEQVQYVSLIDIIDEVMSLLKSIIPSTIVINHRYDDDDDPYLYADPTQIHQILMNLCTNAFQAIGDKQGSITIEHAVVDIDQTFIAQHSMPLPQGEYIQLTITDSGQGMDKSVLDRIFDPFFTTKESGKGTGLGLSVVNGIVKKLSGCIKVDSQIGVGTNFRVYLPVASNQQKETVAQQEEHIPAGEGDLILVVDDEEPVVKMVEKMLVRNKYQVAPFTSSVDALAYFKSNKDAISLVVTDQTMPNIKGNELSVQIKAISEHTPIILITGYSETVTTDNYSQFGINSLILKPLDANNLIQEVHALLSKHQT